MNPPRLRMLLGLAGSIIVAAIALWLLDWHALMSALVRLDAYSLLAAAALSSSTVVTMGLRWAYLLAPRGGRPDPADWCLALVAGVFNLFTPAALGADVYRFAKANDRTLTAGLLVIERIFGVAAFGWYFLAGYAVLRAQGPVDPVFTVAAIAFAGMAVSPLILLVAMRMSLRFLVRSERLFFMRWLSQASAASHAPLKSLVMTALLSALASGCWLATVAVLAKAAGLTLTPAGIAVSATVTEMSRLLPISVQGIGVREAIFAWLATLLGGQAAPAFIACATAYALHFGVVVVIAGIARIVLHARVIDRLPAKPSSLRGIE